MHPQNMGANKIRFVQQNPNAPRKNDKFFP